MGPCFIIELFTWGICECGKHSNCKHVGNSNPLIDHHLGADPFALTYNGRVYIYMSSDDYEYNSDGTIKDNSFANLNKISVISSADMVNWTDHGTIPRSGANGLNGGRGLQMGRSIMGPVSRGEKDQW